MHILYIKIIYIYFELKIGLFFIFKINVFNLTINLFIDSNKIN